MTQNKERLQTILSRRGIASRRQAAHIIADGRVSVNGQKILEPGYRVDPTTNRIRVDDAHLPAQREPLRTLMLNKPRGCVCSLDTGQGPSVMQYVADIQERIVPVGRLDKDSEGLLILSNDGDRVNNLTHPSHGHQKRYRVTVNGDVSPHAMKALRAPITIRGRQTREAHVSIDRKTANGTELIFILGEGRNRQIRRLCKRAMLEVIRLQRTAIGQLKLGSLPPGKWRALSPEEIALASLPVDRL